MWIAIGVTIAVVGTICLAVLINHIIKENVKKNSKYYQAVIKLNEEKQELEIYKNNEFHGYYCSIVGITEDELIKYIQDKLV